MKINQDELLKAISILSENPEYIEMINEGKLNHKEQKEESTFICEEFKVPHNVDEFNKVINNLKDTWDTRPESLKDYLFEFECFYLRDNNTYILKMSIRKHNTPPIYYNEFVFYPDSATNNIYKHTELPEYLSDDFDDIIETCDNTFLETVDMLLDNE